MEALSAQRRNILNDLCVERRKMLTVSTIKVGILNNAMAHMTFDPEVHFRKACSA